jgi:hypothetical protein
MTDPTGPNRPDPDTGWQPGKPAIVLVAGEDGAIIAGWRLPAPLSPVDAIAQVSVVGAVLPPVDPDAWFLVSTEHDPAGGNVLPDFTAELDSWRDLPLPPEFPAGLRYDPGPGYSQTYPGPGGEWQGRSGGLLPSPAAVQAGALAARAVRVTALALSDAVRDSNGILLTGAHLIAAVAGWLRSHHIDPDTGAEKLQPLDEAEAAGGGWGVPGDAGGLPAPLRPAMQALARETHAAQTGAHGAALELNAAIRNPDGTWLHTSDLAAAVAGWLGRMGVAPGDMPPPVWTEPAVLRATRPIPPEGLPLTARHRWVCAWALTVQARATAALPDLVFHGTPNGSGCDVAIQTPGGELVCELANVGYFKSPSGFGAGYEGSGAAALARSLMVAALGTAAACTDCLGAGKVTWMSGTVGGGPVPWLPEHDKLAEETATAHVEKCDGCDGDGLRVHPSVYQAFKRSVVAVLPGEGEWWVSRPAVLSWILERAAGDGAGGLAETAMAMLMLPGGTG